MSDWTKQLDFGAEMSKIRANKSIIAIASNEAISATTLVMAMAAANQKFCKHTNKQSYSDPRDYGWDCPDCGGSK